METDRKRQLKSRAPLSVIKKQIAEAKFKAAEEAKA
jgi:hypothetical protein